MAYIVQSTYKIDETPQPGGGYYVVERHTDNLGRVLTFGPYILSDGMNPQTIMQDRATRLDQEFALREMEEQESSNGKTPWSKLEFRNALGSTVEQSLDELIATFESNPAFPANIKKQMRTGFARYREAQYIERPLRPEVLSMLGLLQSLGMITQEQIDAVIAASLEN